jgi:predicted nuclease of predicted toxin-antitoxin system
LKLLLDQNLAPRLVARLADLFPGSEHVRDVGLAAADDLAVWEYAKAGGFAIVSKDADFRQLSFLYGSPPKVVWLRVGNQSTAQIEAVVRANAGALRAFDADPVASMLVVTA